MSLAGCISQSLREGGRERERKSPPQRFVLQFNVSFTDKGGILIFIGAAGFNATNGAIVYTKLAL